MRVGRKSSADAASFLLTLMALKMCLLQRVIHASLSLGTRLESISITSGTIQKQEIKNKIFHMKSEISTVKIMRCSPAMGFWKMNQKTLTCDGFDYAVRNFRNLLIYRNTQHLYGDPVQSSETECKNNSNLSCNNSTCSCVSFELRRMQNTVMRIGVGAKINSCKNCNSYPYSYVILEQFINFKKRFLFNVSSISLHALTGFHTKCVCIVKPVKLLQTTLAVN